MQESILSIFLKIWSFYPKSANFSCFVTLEMIILVRAINVFKNTFKMQKYLTNRQINLH